MRLRCCGWGLLFCLGSLLLRAEESAQPLEPLHFTFALPPFESRISLGVFNAAGELVARLAEARPERDFTIGLNGLMVTWDGKDDAGREVPPGRYRVRGYAVGAMPVEGLAYSGNGWVEEFGAAFPLAEMLDWQLAPDGSLVLLYRQDDGRAALASFSVDQGVRWQRVLEDAPSPEPWKLAQMTGGTLVLLHGREGLAVKVETGDFLHQGILPEGVVAAALGAEGELSWLGEGREGMVNLLGWREEGEQELPFAPRVLVLGESGPLALSKEGQLWEKTTAGWQIVPAWAEERFVDIAPGRGEEFWGLLRTSEGTPPTRAGLFSRAGEFLKEIHPGTFSQPPQRILAAPGRQEVFFAAGSAEEDGAQVIWGIRPTPPSESTAPGWEIFLQKQVDGKAAWPEGFKRLPVRLQLETTNFLRREREKNHFRLTVRRPDTIQLESAEGLHLADLVRTAPIVQAGAFWSAAQPGALRFLVQSRAWSEEFLLTGLEELLALDVAEFDWPSDAE